MFARCLLLLLVLYEFQVFSGEISRLLVSIDADSSFSPKEFSEAASATLVQVEPRNPYKAIEPLFLEEPFIVLSDSKNGFDPRRNTSNLDHLASRYGYRLVIFKNESLDEAVTLATQLLNTNPKYTSDLKQLTLEESLRLYTLLEKIDRVLRSNDIAYWAGRETLLGAVRHGGFLPWDDYIHLFILESDKEKLEQAIGDFESSDLVLHSYYKDFYKVFPTDGLPLEDEDGFLPFRYPGANIFLMTLEKRNELNDEYVHFSYNFYSNWNHDRFTFSQIENVFRVPFGPTSINIPGSPDLYLNRLYGFSSNPNLWKKYSIELLWDHRIEDNTLYQGAALVEVDNFEPAPW